MTAREYTPRPGTNWDQHITRGLEQLVCDQGNGDSPFGWAEPDPAGFVSTALDPEPAVPRLNRATRRALGKHRGRRQP